MNVPDTKLAREATELVRDTTSELIYHHSRRVYFWGSLQGRNRDLSFDPELLYIGAMFHDLGLSERFHGSGRRFEVDSADEARRFLAAHGAPEDSVRRVWTAIALHTTPGIPSSWSPKSRWSRRVWSTTSSASAMGTSATPIVRPLSRCTRPDFKTRILQAFTEGIRSKPETTFGNVKADVLAHYVPGFERGDFVRTIQDSPWAE